MAKDLKAVTCSRAVKETHGLRLVSVIFTVKISSLCVIKTVENKTFTTSMLFEMIIW